jgi:UDP:flavonoid glycosyltransferase YjiC (YdhE family)
MMPLANAARAAGHDVTFAIAGEFVGRLERLGYRTLDVGLTFEEAFGQFAASGYPNGLPRDDDGRPDLDAGGHLFVNVFGRTTAADLAPRLDDLAPDLVVYEHYDIGAGVAARAAGIPSVALRVSPFMPAPVERRYLGGKVAALYADFGVPIDESAGEAEPFIDLFPAAVQEPRAADRPNRLPLRHTSYSDPGAVVPRWIGSGDRPLVYVTLGTVVSGDDQLRPAIEAVAALDAEVLVTLGNAEGAALGALPANVRIAQFVDQGAVLDHAALAVHHGGSGTMLDCLSRAVPQVVLPKGADQFINADLLVAAGLAAVLEPADASTEAISDAARRTIGTSSPALSAVRRRIAEMPDADAALDALAALAPVVA